MGVFDFLKKRKSELSREQKKWNKMWDLWAEHRADTPYAEVMTIKVRSIMAGTISISLMLSKRAICKRKFRFWRTSYPKNCEAIC